eukprot:GHVP01062748.1.p1 GENE.GHVP01062748.1~~GHVP01062748.1.p1  ORF type:complete len:508 (-),score=87.10 GHVP01062748.1:1593-3116(-)
MLIEDRKSRRTCSFYFISIKQNQTFFLMLSISHLYILSARGDVITFRDFRNDLVRGLAEVFLRKVRFWPNGDPPPIFNLDGVNYATVKRNGMYFVAATQQNPSPVTLLSFIHHLIKILKDFCGILNEEAIRRNFALVYEILEEAVDFGHIQIFNTDELQIHTFNEPLPLEHSVSVGSSSIGNFKQTGSKIVGAAAQTIAQTTGRSSAIQKWGKSVPAMASSRPLSVSCLESSKRNEIFVDVIERQTVTLNSAGIPIDQFLDGSVVVKSFVAHGVPLRLGVMENLFVGTLPSTSDNSCLSSDGVVLLDDCNFHMSCNVDEFAKNKTLTFVPPGGEFVLLNYRMSAPFNPPFKIHPSIEYVADNKIEFVAKLKADFSPSFYGSNISVIIPVPSFCISASSSFFPKAEDQSADFNATELTVTWSIKKLTGGSECALRCRLTRESRKESEIDERNASKQFGPILLNFEIPMLTASNLQIKFLRLADPASAEQQPYRWVRYVTQSRSYVCRI